MSTTAAPEAMRRNEPKEDRFVFHATLPTLQEMMGYQMAKKIWYNYIACFKPNNFKKRIPFDGDILNGAFGLELQYYQETYSWIDRDLPIPIRDVINDCINKLIVETRRWVEHFRNGIMRSDNLGSYLISQFDPNWCVWLPNGDLDYKQTAVKMVSMPGLSEVQKFAIMCKYCLEDKIKAFPIRSLPAKFISSVIFDKDPLIYYWICLLKNELFKIPLDSYKTAELKMVVKCCLDHWYAFEYFWQRLNARNQVILANARLTHTSLSQERILSKMTYQQQRRLLSMMPDKIITNFWLQMDSPQSALWAWRNCRSRLTAEQFAQLVTEIYKSKISNEKDMRLLVLIWDTAPDNLKNYVVETQENKILEAISYLYNGSSSGIKFLQRFLSMKSADFKKQTILKIAARLAKSFKNAALISEVIDSCLPNADDRLECKRLMMDSDDMKSHCEVLINNNHFEELNLKLQFFSPDVNTAREYKKRLLESRRIDSRRFITKLEKWAELCKFIDNSFPDDSTLASCIKKQFVSSYAATFQNFFRGIFSGHKGIRVLISNDHLDTSGLNETMQVVESIFQNEEMLSVKRLFATPFQRIFTNEDFWSYFANKKFLDFVQWCLSDDGNALPEFKKAVPVDAIFDKTFNDLNDDYTGCGYFEADVLPGLDNCLVWSFSDVETAKKYKIDRIQASGELTIFKSLAERNDEASLEILLKWFYDGDEAAIRSFRKKKLKSK